MNLDMATYFDMVDGHQRANPYERVGQAYFNVLAEVRPDIASRVRASAFDPFFKRSVKEISPRFFEFIAKEW